MSFPWSKKGPDDDGGPELHEGPAGQPPPVPGAARALAEGLGALARALGEVQQQIGQYLAQQRAPAPEGVSGEVMAKLDAIGERLQRQLDDGLRQLAERLAPARKVESAPPTGADWERAVLGPVIAERSNLAFQRAQLLRGVLDGDAAACSLAGSLLVFQSAAAERMPQLLKEIGEAYYRWQPKTAPGANPLEEALAGWLQSVCDGAGIGNRIELVHPGERFDAARHNALSRGVEVAEVHGWVVVRDNGKVYTKANVSAR